MSTKADFVSIPIPPKLALPAPAQPQGNANAKGKGGLTLGVKKRKLPELDEPVPKPNVKGKRVTAKDKRSERITKACGDMYETDADRKAEAQRKDRAALSAENRAELKERKAKAKAEQEAEAKAIAERIAEAKPMKGLSFTESQPKSAKDDDYYIDYCGHLESLYGATDQLGLGWSRWLIGKAIIAWEASKNKKILKKEFLEKLGLSKQVGDRSQKIAEKFTASQAKTLGWSQMVGAIYPSYGAKPKPQEPKSTIERMPSICESLTNSAVNLCGLNQLDFDSLDYDKCHGILLELVTAQYQLSLVTPLVAMRIDELKLAGCAEIVIETTIDKLKDKDISVWDILGREAPEGV